MQACGVNRAHTGEVEHPNNEKVTGTLSVRAVGAACIKLTKNVEWRTTREVVKRSCDKSCGLQSAPNRTRATEMNQSDAPTRLGLEFRRCALSVSTAGGARGTCG